MDVDVTRRQAIAGGGVFALLLGGIGVSHYLRGAAFVPPGVPAEQLEADGWVKLGETQEVVLDDSAGPINVEAKAVTVRYEDRALVERILDTDVTIEYQGLTATRRLGDYVGSQFDQSMGVFAATKIDVTPHIDELPAGLGQAEVMGPVRSQAQQAFEDQLREAGLENVRQTGTSTLDIDTGGTADRFEYAATFRFEETTIDVQGATIDVPGTDLEVAGYLALWHTGSNVLVAAGAHPNENYADTVTDTYQGEEITIEFDLGLRPSQMREDLLGYMAAVE